MCAREKGEVTNSLPPCKWLSFPRQAGVIDTTGSEMNLFASGGNSRSEKSG